MLLKIFVITLFVFSYFLKQFHCLLPLCRFFVTFYFFYTPTSSHHSPCSSLSNSAICTITTVKVTAKKGKKAVSKTLKANVKVVNAGLKFTAAPTEMAVGTEDKVTTKKCPTAAKVSYKSSDDTIATVDATTGAVKAVKAGKVTITATSDYGKSVTTDITVKKAILKDAVQAKYDTITATIIGDTKDIKVGDLKITNTTTKVVAPVKSIKAQKADATKYDLTLYGGLTDGKEYTLEYDGTTVSFTVTDGKMADLKLSKDTVAFGSEQEVKVQTVDANGIVIEDFDLNASGKKVTTKQTAASAGAYVSGTKVYLKAKGDTMTFEATYGEGKWDQTGKDSTEYKKTLTVTAVDPTEANYAYSVTLKDNTTAPSWKAASFKAVDTLNVGEVKNAFIRIQNTAVDPVADIATADYAKYTVESSDATKLLMAKTTLSGASVGSNYVAVKAVGAGTAYIIVKKDNTYVASIPVTVQAKSVATTIDVTPANVTVVSGATATQDVKITVKDQYDKKMTLAAANVQKFELISKPNNATAPTAPTVSVDNGSLKYAYTNTSFTNAKVGNYVYKVTLKIDNVVMTRTITYTVVDNTAATGYDIEFTSDKIDTTVAKDATAGKTQTIKIVEMKNGGKDKYYEGAVSSVAISKADGTLLAKVGAMHTNAASGLVTCAAVSASAYTAGSSGNASTVDIAVSTVSTSAISGGTANCYQKNLAAGTYVVDVQFLPTGATTPVSIRKTFEVEDKQAASVTATIKNQDFGSNTITTAFENPALSLVTLNYDGQDITTAGNFVVTKVNADLQNGTAFLTSVEGYVRLTDGEHDQFVPVTITAIDKSTLTNCAGK